MELPVAKRETIHRVLDKLARDPLSFCDYIFFEFGIPWVSHSLRAHDLATTSDQGMFAEYSITAAGLAMLDRLNYTFGAPPPW